MKMDDRHYTFNRSLTIMAYIIKGIILCNVCVKALTDKGVDVKGNRPIFYTIIGQRHCLYYGQLKALFF